MKGNFNRSFAGKNSTSYGQGSYFARDASYSARVRKGGENYSVPNEEGFKFVILCRVLVGDFCRGSETFKVPPDMPDGTRRYDTTVDNTEDPTVFVTYNDAQVYPEYIVKFQDTSPESVGHGEMTKLNAEAWARAEARARCQSGAAQGKRTNASQPSPTKAERGSASAPPPKPPPWRKRLVESHRSNQPPRAWTRLRTLRLPSWCSRPPRPWPRASSRMRRKAPGTAMPGWTGDAGRIVASGTG